MTQETSSQSSAKDFIAKKAIEYFHVHETDIRISPKHQYTKALVHELLINNIHGDPVQSLELHIFDTNLAIAALSLTFSGPQNERIKIVFFNRLDAQGQFDAFSSLTGIGFSLLDTFNVLTWTDIDIQGMSILEVALKGEDFVIKQLIAAQRVLNVRPGQMDADELEGTDKTHFLDVILQSKTQVGDILRFCTVISEVK